MPEAVRALFVLDSGVSRTALERALSDDGIDLVGVAEGIDELRHRFREAANDVLVVAIAGQSEDALRLIEDAIAAQPDRPVVVIGDGSESQFTQRVFASGAADMLVQPVAGDDLLFALHKVLARRAGAGDAAGFTQAALVCLFGPKGGTGKTVTATSLSVALTELGKTVALVDLDLQFGDVGLCLGVLPQTTIFDLVEARGVLDEEKLSGFMPTHSSGIRLLLAPRVPDQAGAVSIEFLQRLYPTLRRMVEYVVVDTPPGFTAEVIATIGSATSVCAVGTLDILSLKDTALGLNALDLIGVPRDKIKLILNRAGSSVGISDADVSMTWGREPDILVPSDREIVRAVNAGQSILTARPNSEAAAAFRKLARQLTDEHALADDSYGLPQQ